MRSTLVHCAQDRSENAYGRRHGRRALAVAVAPLLVLGACAKSRGGDSPWAGAAAVTELVPGEGLPEEASISADGRFVVFVTSTSRAPHYTRPHAADILLFDRATGSGERIAVDERGRPADGACARPRVSADGRFVAFESSATNLVAGDTNHVQDVFVRDRQLQLTTRVSVASNGEQGNDQSRLLALSADGQVVLFESSASNLAPGSVPPNIVRHDLRAGKTEVVSVDKAGRAINASSPSLARDGRLLAFSSADIDVGNEHRGLGQVFVRDLGSGAIEPCSVSSSGEAAKNASSSPSLSADGRFVAFVSEADNLVPRDRNRVADVFVRDRQSGTTERVSVDSRGHGLSAPSSDPALSDDGRFVVFISAAPELTGGRNEAAVWVHDRSTGSTDLISAAPDGTTARGAHPSLAGSGRAVVFVGSRLVPGDLAQYSVYVRVPAVAGALHRPSPPTGGAPVDLYPLGGAPAGAEGPGATTPASAPTPGPVVLRAPAGVIEEAVFDPAEVYILGELTENRIGRGLVHASDPGRVVGGAPFAATRLTIRPRDGRLLYLAREDDTVRQLVPDRILWSTSAKEWYVSEYDLWDPVRKSWVDVEGGRKPMSDDPVVQPVRSAECPVGPFFVDPATSDVLRVCSSADSPRDQTASRAARNPGGGNVVALSARGLQLEEVRTSLVLADRAGSPRPVVGLPDGATVVAARSLAGTGLRVCVKIAAAGRLEQWTIDEGGLASLAGEYAPVPTGVELADAVALDGAGNAWVTGFSEHWECVVRLPLSPALATVVYSNGDTPEPSKRPFVRIEQLVTGP